MPACRYAREIAQLKTKLAEKDAQLLGGFGSIEHLTTGQYETPTSLGAFSIGSLSPGALQLGSSALQHPALQHLPLQHPALQELAFPGIPLQYAAAATTAAAGAAAGPVGELQSSSRLPSRNGTSNAAAAAAGGDGRVLPKLSRDLHGSSSQGSSVTSSRRFTQQDSYALRAGSAEARLVHRDAQSPAGSAASKPSSPLLPSALQQQNRLTNSADGARSPGAAVGSFSRASQPPQQRRGTGDTGMPQQAWGPSSPQHSSPQQPQQRQALQSHPAAESDEEGG